MKPLQFAGSALKCPSAVKEAMSSTRWAQGVESCASIHLQAVKKPWLQFSLERQKLALRRDQTLSARCLMTFMINLCDVPSKLRAMAALGLNYISRGLH